MPRRFRGTFTLREAAHFARLGTRGAASLVEARVHEGRPRGLDFADPMGGADAAFVRVAEEIRDALPALLETVSARAGGRA
ncbi:hypothetical protein [Tomitella gaofuii]|uniref:hypothetical protein n=1 Tax=Tomitella gaofuii TaxID=2760083 RepID=UPI0027E55BB0|nr:hypothetical protein [Tomitella gaofuii]